MATNVGESNEKQDIYIVSTYLPTIGLLIAKGKRVNLQISVGETWQKPP